MPGHDLTVQLFIKLTDSLCQLCQLLCNDSMVYRLGGVRLHIKLLRQKVSVAFIFEK